ncbi:MAG: hypothetical protein HND42_02085 [Armatimonadetes bacterium]|nr:MAG: hypothetical protein EDM73_05840 [Armatimonadota bacterium]MCE7900080.1 hypothetical protein [Armatimonadetes bacterium ATM1]MDL1929384.1 hypothetical protein [Fimbriimonadia bacterium ATM]MBC6968951.1 hypothetical protein [Armatimonadota bacterium]MBL1148985.1 hypothetical protein [Armatimonadota bacterium]
MASDGLRATIYAMLAVGAAFGTAVLIGGTLNCIELREVQHRVARNECILAVGNAFAAYIEHANGGRVEEVSIWSTEMRKYIEAQYGGDGCPRLLEGERIAFRVPNEIIGKKLSDLPAEQTLLEITGSRAWSAFTVQRTLVSRRRDP